MSLARPRPALITALVILGAIAIAALAGWRGVSASAQARTGLRIAQDAKAGTITVLRAGRRGAIVTQNAPPDARPYIHPIAAPDGKGVLTEFSPEHHKHQTGLYWGFTRLNGRDYFHNRQGDYWRRVSATVTQASGDEVRWQTVYDLLDEAGNAVLTETQRWSVREDRGRFLLDLEWRGEARDRRHDRQVRLRRAVPPHAVARGHARRSRQCRAAAQRARRRPARDVDRRRRCRSTAATTSRTSRIFDHPDNAGYPQAWRVDGQFGVGTARDRATADWTIKKGEREVIRHRLVAYTGTLDDVKLTADWSEYSGNRSTYATQALWGIAQREGREEKFPHPEQAAAAMTSVAGLRGQGVGRRADDPAADGVLLGRPRTSLGRGEPRLRDARPRILQGRQQPHPHPRGHQSRRHRRQPQGVHGGHRLSVGARRGIRWRLRRRAAEPPLHPRSRRRRQGRRRRDRSAADRLGQSAIGTRS